MVAQPAKTVAYILICTKEIPGGTLSFTHFFISPCYETFVVLLRCHLLSRGREPVSQQGAGLLCCCTSRISGVGKMYIALFMSGDRRERKGGRKEDKEKKKVDQGTKDFDSHRDASDANKPKNNQYKYK